MYEAFYGLSEKPFNLTPDQKFLYLSEKHKEAFAHLLYGIKNRSGFVMVTGEIGTGKTTICRNLLNQLDEGETEVAFIFNPALNPVELLKKINTEFGVSAKGETVLELVEALNVYLLETASKGINCVLVIDEAQNLAPQVLEQIRLLSNLETETTKLLQIILIGQPELGEKLALHELRQLNQRITARYHLKPLNATETMQYIAYRLHVAGGRGKVKFARKAIHAIHRFSGGTPRVINAICDRALLIGYTKEVHTITTTIVRRAADEIRGEKIRQPKNWRDRIAHMLPSPALTVIAAMVIFSIFTLVHSFAPALRELSQSLDRFSQLFAPANSQTSTSPDDKEIVEASEKPAEEPTGLSPEEIRSALQELPIYNAIQEQLEIGPTHTDPLGKFLKETNPTTVRNTALRTLASAWGIDVTLGLPRSGDPDVLSNFAESLGLSCEVLEPALDQILTINYPALVKINTPTGPSWLTIVSATEDTVNLSSTPGETIEVSRADFTKHYAGEAQYWWNDSNPTAGNLLQGQQGNAVAALKKQLRDLNRLSPSATSNAYDAKTAQAVARLQAEAGLNVDGIAGKQVRMVLSSWDAESNAPKIWGSPLKVAELINPDNTEVIHPALEEENPAVPPTESGSSPEPEQLIESTSSEESEVLLPVATSVTVTSEEDELTAEVEPVSSVDETPANIVEEEQPATITPDTDVSPTSETPAVAPPESGVLEIEELPEPTAYNSTKTTLVESLDA